MTREVGQLYQAAMVRALLRRRDPKTNTRRSITLKNGHAWHDLDAGLIKSADGEVYSVHTLLQDRRHPQPGDIIWVRETWGYNPDHPGAAGRACYRADPGHEHDGITWRPSIHMPREACRLLLTCTAVRIERLLSITEADALAEGIEPYRGPLRWVRYLDAVTGEAAHSTARDAYLALWDHINGQGAAAQNPWVRSIYFQRKEA